MTDWKEATLESRMTLEQIKEKIKKCLRKLYTQDAVLFERNQSKGLCERCLVFRFGLYLQKEFPNHFVDCDFNSASVNSRDVRGKPITDTDGRTSTNRFVDIIIHKRTTQTNTDFICFEIKKWNNYDKEATEKDKNNLKVLTSEYGYKYGFYLILGKSMEKTKWVIFRRGGTPEETSPVFTDERTNE